jgi:hypothetical protein
MQFLLYEIKNLQDGGLTSGISETTHTKFSSKLDLAFCVLKIKENFHEPTQQTSVSSQLITPLLLGRYIIGLREKD